jgi:capsular polysaccharide biosynthesis protein
MKLSLVLEQKKKIALITGATVLLSLVLSLLHPLEYSASNRLLVIQPTNVAVDAYSATKSVERINEKLADVAYTTSFFDKVTQNPEFLIATDYFKTKERKKRKQWSKMVETRVIRGAGMLELTVYHTNKAQALEILRSMTHVYHKNGWEYVGSMNVQITEVDSPLISTWPVRPNFILHGFLGLILGFIASLVYLSYTHQQEQVAHLVKKALKTVKKLDGTMADLVAEPVAQTTVDELIIGLAQKNKHVSDEQSETSAHEEVTETSEPQAPDNDSVAHDAPASFPNPDGELTEEQLLEDEFARMRKNDTLIDRF